MQAARVSTSLRASYGTSSLRRRPVCHNVCASLRHASTVADLFDKRNGARVMVVVRTSMYISSIGFVACICPGLVMRAVNCMTRPAGAAVVCEAVCVRLGGLLAMLFGMYYAGAALDDLDGKPPMRLYRSTVIGRWLFALATLAIFIAEMPTLHGWLLVLGGMNAVSALALHRQLER
mmetsp:Transcript_7761/g.21141  ORF Transcript_7761/g.21141 Transcript_7761/m.21141 type:complete len:177 (+) Transcript_7761:255-785(+)